MMLESGIFVMVMDSLYAFENKEVDGDFKINSRYFHIKLA